MQQVLTVMHAFYAAKVAQVDPNFSFDNSFWVTYSTEMDFNKSHFNIDDKNWLFFSHIITWKRIKFNNHFDNIASKFVYQIQLCERASYSYCARSWRQQTYSSRKNFPSGWKCYKKIDSYVSGAFIEIWSTWEV